MKLNETLQKVFDVCIIGSGPAGTMLALEYARLMPSGSVALVEYGNGKNGGINELDDRIQFKQPQYHHPPNECTNKGLGGTSATWGGRCVMWDEIDFMSRPVLHDGCCWSTDLFDEVNKYVPAAAKYFECGAPIFNLSQLPRLNKKIAENFVEGIVTDTVLERWSMPTRFGTRYKRKIETLPNLVLLAGYEARDFSNPVENGKVEYLTIRDVITKDLYIIKAKYFVIASGGHESTRLLLRNKQLFNTLGQVPCALGKYYQGHVSGKIASVRFYGDPKKTNFGFLRDEDGVYLRRRFQFSTDFLLSENLLNAAIWLDNPLFHDPVHGNGAMSFMYLAMITPFIGKKLAPAAIAHSITKGKRYRVGKHILNVIKDLPKSLVIPASIFYRRYCRRRKLPGIFLYNPQNIYALHFHAEQVAEVSNRMELADDGETLVISYQLTDADVNSVIRLHEVLDSWLRKCNCGQLEYWYPKHQFAQVIREASRGGIHQSGTTRIGDSPAQGVVDRNLKVWGTKNVYVCSSSAFPTSGQANPTFLLGAFALRLANHLAQSSKN